MDPVIYTQYMHKKEYYVSLQNIPSVSKYTKF